jgi:hypothetical protein
MASDPSPPKRGHSGNRQAEIEAKREAKLAQALRANLRRRKAEPKGGEREKASDEAGGPGDGDST